MDHAARHALRWQNTPPLLDQLRAQILTMSNERGGQSLQLYARAVAEVDPLHGTSRP
jgi:hypothetical protein